MITTDGTTNTLDLGNQQDTAQGSLDPDQAQRGV